MLYADRHYKNGEGVQRCREGQGTSGSGGHTSRFRGMPCTRPGSFRTDFGVTFHVLFARTTSPSTTVLVFFILVFIL